MGLYLIGCDRKRGCEPVVLPQSFCSQRRLADQRRPCSISQRLSIDHGTSKKHVGGLLNPSRHFSDLSLAEYAASAVNSSLVEASDVRARVPSRSLSSLHGT
ncbi:hypothetical protein SprV_0501896900 [Sparganum proliferum]